MKKTLAILLMLLIAVGCEDSTQSDQPNEMTFKKIPAGTFMMGSPEKEGHLYDEEQHNVTITKAFYMQTTEVTQGQWKEVMGTEPWKGKRYVKEGPTTQRRT